MANTPFKMKGSPFKRNFGLPVENIDENERNIIEEEKQKIVDTVSYSPEEDEDMQSNNMNNKI